MDEPLMPSPSAPPEAETEAKAEAEGKAEDVMGGEPQQAEEQGQEPQRLYPDPFYCPLTKKVMEDPVVGPEGDSFEKSAVLERDAADYGALQARTYYPNRALEVVIEKETQRVKEQGTARGALRRAEASLRAGFEQILEKSAFPAGEHRPLPDVYYCPITLDPISRPAIDPDGNTYERRAIRGWVRANGTSPLTRKEMSEDQLRDNKALEDLIDAEVNKDEQSIHPSMRRLKENRLEEGDEGDEESGYPTSQEEIDEASRRRRCNCGGESLDSRWPCTCAKLILFSVIALGIAPIFLPVEALFFFLLFALFICFDCRDQ